MKFVHELNRVAAPGATIILLTWCHRDLSPLEQDLHPDEKKLLSQLESSIRIKWISAADYINLFKSCSLEVFNCGSFLLLIYSISIIIFLHHKVFLFPII